MADEIAQAADSQHGWRFGRLAWRHLGGQPEICRSTFARTLMATAPIRRPRPQLSSTCARRRDSSDAHLRSAVISAAVQRRAASCTQEIIPHTRSST